MIYTWKVQSFGYGPSKAILRWYFFILFPNFSISFQTTHPVLPIQLPPSTWCFAIAKFQPTVQIVATWQRPFIQEAQTRTEVKNRNNQAIVKPRTCCLTAKDEIQCQRDVHSSWVPLLKSCVIPASHLQLEAQHLQHRGRHMQRYKILKGPFTKMQFVVICLNLIFKKQWVYSFSIWGTSKKTRNVCSLQSALTDLNKEKLQRFKPKKDDWTTWAGLLLPFRGSNSGSSQHVCLD